MLASFAVVDAASLACLFCDPLACLFCGSCQHASSSQQRLQGQRREGETDSSHHLACPPRRLRPTSTAACQLLFLWPRLGALASLLTSHDHVFATGRLQAPAHGLLLAARMAEEVTDRSTELAAPAAEQRMCRWCWEPPDAEPGTCVGRGMLCCQMSLRCSFVISTSLRPSQLVWGGRLQR